MSVSISARQLSRAEDCLVGFTLAAAATGAIPVPGASTAIVEALPDRIATVDLSYCTIAGGREGPLVATSSLVRKGKTIIMVRAEVADGHGSDDPAAAEQIGVGFMKFSVIPHRPDHADISPSGRKVLPRSSMALPDSGFSEPLIDRAGIRLIDDENGIVEVAKTDLSDGKGTRVKFVLTRKPKG